MLRTMLPHPQPPINLKMEVPYFFNKFEANIRAYYGKDAKKVQTLEEFIDWFRRNKDLLIVQFQQDLQKGTIEVVDSSGRKSNFKNIATLEDCLAFWLGIKYSIAIGSKFSGLQNENLLIPISVLDSVEGPNTFSRIIGYFNIGLHEGTHSLPDNFGESCSLSEVATFLVTTRYGLPILEDHLDELPWHWLSGKRYFPHMMDRLLANKPFDPLFTFKHEYLAYIFGPWFLKYLERTDLFEFSIRGEPVEGSLTARYGSDMGFLNVFRKIGSCSGAKKRVEMAHYLATQLYRDFGITDENLLRKLKHTFELIVEYMTKHPNLLILAKDSSEGISTELARQECKKFFLWLLDLLNKTYGKPEKKFIPDRYAMLGAHS